MAKEIFAKIFEDEDRMYLVEKGTNEDTEEDNYDHPEVRISTTSNNGHRLTMKLTLEEGAEDKRDALFERMTLDSCIDLFVENPFMEF